MYNMNENASRKAISVFEIVGRYTRATVYAEMVDQDSFARRLASAVGAAPYVDGPHSAAGYMHYHIKGKKLRGFKSFHVWFSMRDI